MSRLGISNALGDVFLGMASALKRDSRKNGLMRLTGSGYGLHCHVNPYHIYVVSSHREREQENYDAEPNTDICLSSTSMTVVESVSKIVEECRTVYGLPLIRLNVTNFAGGEYWLNARKVVTVFPNDEHTCCVKTGKFRLFVNESVESLVGRINDAISKRKR